LIGGLLESRIKDVDAGHEFSSNATQNGGDNQLDRFGLFGIFDEKNADGDLTVT
jgi:hypothetical protein